MEPNKLELEIKKKLIVETIQPSALLGSIRGNAG
jgi:hypothetical protein